MTAEEGEENMGVRLHVGGLARGVQPTELAALIARAFPQGAVAPTAEIMRDSTTGIERGFGYVNISPGGQGVKDGVERAIAAYNGTRWKGSKIRISLAKGDYMQRLQCEWREEAARTEEIARKSRDHQNASSSHKDPPLLRLRKRPGERVILVDPKPVPWEIPTRSKAGGEGRGEAGGHRRKRGVLGCRRRVTFPGGVVKTSSTTCRDLWRKHLQEVTAETNAARKRSSVESLVLSEAQRRTSARDRTDAAIPQILSPTSRRKDRDVAEEEEEDRDVAGDLPPEEPPAPEGIEFVWDDGKEDDEGGALSRSEHDDDEQYGVGNKEYDEDNIEQDEKGMGGSPDADRKDVKVKAGNKWDCYGNEKAAVAGDQDLPDRPAADERSIGRRAVSIREKLSRLGRNHGLEIDDRLAEFLSDDEADADAVGGTFDYELETAERVGSTTDNTAVEPGQEGLEGMSERLRAENKHSLELLAEVLGAAPGDSSAAPSSTADPATYRLEGPETPAQPLRTEKNDQRSLLVNDAVAEGGGDSVRETKESEKKWRRSGNGDNEDGTLAVSNEKTRSAAGEEGVRSSKAPEGGASGTQNATQESSSAKKRFVTHMSTLTDIFKVEDKIGTKKNKEEKERDKGFKLAPLFDSLGGASGGGVLTPGEGFSFSFGAEGDEETAGSSSAAFDVDSSGVEVEPRSKGQTGSLSVDSDNLQDPQSLEGGDSYAGNEGEKQTMLLWRPLEDMEAVAMRFVRSDKREEVEAAWLEERRALTHDFKRKHKDAVKGRRGFGVQVGGGAKRKRR